jgi:hypothetical protein
MASLITPHWETITQDMKELFLILGRHPFSRRFYLAGGTALSLQIGHRRSVDLDFFSEMDEVDESSRREIIHALNPLSPQVVESVGGNLLMVINGIRVGFFGYGYPLIDEIVLVEKNALASIVDIGLMKCDAVISRGSRKDFYDLFYIAMQFPLAKMLDLGKTKYPLFRDFPLMFLESMILFDQADRDVQPDLVDYLPWEEIKSFFIQQSKLLSQNWFYD